MSSKMQCLPFLAQLKAFQFQHSGIVVLVTDQMIFYAFLEPIGSAPPKFSVKDKINAFGVTLAETFAMVCPAQGFPLPAFR